MAVKFYTQEFRELMETIYGVKSEFGSFFGDIDVDGISNSEEAFQVKTLDIPTAIGEYSIDENVGMGTGTSNSSRFGKMREVKAVNKSVPYKFNYSENLGIDAFTVNDDIDYVVAKTMEGVTNQLTERFNKAQSEAIAEAASKELELEDMTSEAVDKLFDELSAYFVNIKAQGIKVAKVSALVHNLILSSNLTTTLKQSGATNIDTGEVTMYKGFVIEQLAEDYFGDGDVVYAYIANIGKAFTGISIVRTIDEHPGFAGVAVQVAGKYGDYIPEENKRAIVKVKSVPEVPEA